MRCKDLQLNVYQTKKARSCGLFIQVVIYDDRHMQLKFFDLCLAFQCIQVIHHALLHFLVFQEILNL
jgi:hypothetical protein